MFKIIVNKLHNFQIQLKNFTLNFYPTYEKGNNIFYLLEWILIIILWTYLVVECDVEIADTLFQIKLFFVYRKLAFYRSHIRWRFSYIILKNPYTKKKIFLPELFILVALIFAAFFVVLTLYFTYFLKRKKKLKFE